MRLAGGAEQFPNIGFARFRNQPVRYAEQSGVIVVPPSALLGNRLHHVGGGAPALLGRLNQVAGGYLGVRLDDEASAGFLMI